VTEDCPIVKCMEKEYLLPDTGKPIQLQPHQREVLNWMFTPTEDGSLRYRTYVYSTPKKEGKTELGGAIAYSYARTYGGDCLSVANDKEQAQLRMYDRVLNSMAYAKEKRPQQYRKVIDDDCWEKGYVGSKSEANIIFKDVGQANPGPHQLRFIPTDYAGEAGALNALVVFDELWAYSGESMARLYTELQPIQAIPYSIRVITTYAGFYGESELLWNIYEDVVDPDPQTDEARGQKIPGLEHLPLYEKGPTCVYWSHENLMPWNTPEFIEDARQDPALKTRPGEFARLWENRWSTGASPYLDPKLIDELMERGDQMGLVNNLAPERFTI